ncbi:13032_t:CDS:2, partial [Gigaspora rosea]
VATLVEELAELVKEQQEKIARCLFHQHEKKNKKNTLKNEFTTKERKDSQFNLQKPKAGVKNNLKFGPRSRQKGKQNQPQTKN